jgi:hypothetical protein
MVSASRRVLRERQLVAERLGWLWSWRGSILNAQPNDFKIHVAID